MPLAKARAAAHSPKRAKDEDPWNLLGSMLKHANLHKDALQ